MTNIARSANRIGFQNENLSAAFARMLMDPCKARLTYGPMGGSSDSGYLLRVQSRFVLHGTSAANNGYLVWFPDFHAFSNAPNLFTFETATPSTAPLNTIAVPYGTGSATTSTAQRDPANQWVSGSNCAAARTLAGCVRIFSTAAVSNVAGQFAVTTGITPHQLLNSGSPSGCMSVVDFATFSQDVERMDLMTKEVKHAPSTNSSIFRPLDVNSAVDSSGNCLLLGIVTASNTTVGPLASQTNGIAVSWMGLSTSGSAANDLVIELVKIIEWLPDSNSGVTEPQYPVRPTTTYEDIQSSFLRQQPDWQTRIYDTARDLAHTGVSAATNNLINRVYTGATAYAMNRMTQAMLVPAI